MLGRPGAGALEHFSEELGFSELAPAGVCVIRDVLEREGQPERVLQARGALRDAAGGVCAKLERQELVQQMVLRALEGYQHDVARGYVPDVSVR